MVAAARSFFNTEAEVAPALLHAAKSKMLCELRSVSVCKEDVLRLRVHPESLGFASVVCRLSSFSESPAQPRNPEKDDLGTDKHRMLWMISTSELRCVSGQDHARSAGYQDYRTQTAALRFPRSSWTLPTKKALFMSSQQLQRRIFTSYHAGPRCQRSRGLSRRGARVEWQHQVPT